MKEEINKLRNNMSEDLKIVAKEVASKKEWDKFMREIVMSVLIENWEDIKENRVNKLVGMLQWFILAQ